MLTFSSYGGGGLSLSLEYSLDILQVVCLYPVTSRSSVLPGRGSCYPQLTLPCRLLYMQIQEVGQPGHKVDHK